MIWLVILALAVGMLLPIQVGVNAQLRVSLGDPLVAATVSFLVGTFGLILAMAAFRSPLPSLEAALRAPWSSWIGGFLGAMYVGMAIILAPRLGAATLTAAVVAGQMLTSIVLDHYGWVGFEQHPLNVWRLAGAGLLIAGVVLIQR